MSHSIRYATPPSSEITPQAVYMNRRAFLRTAGLFGAGAALAACTPRPTATAVPGLEPSAGAATDELGDSLTPFDAITHYNNYYEFSTNKEAVADLASTFPTRPWTVEVGGLGRGKWIDRVEPMTSAAYIGFTTLLDPEQMPGQRSPFYPWPYTEGLRLDEARHELALLATGMYGEALLPPNGAPLRLVVPWKYGFKSIKAIVRIDLLEAPPATLWSSVGPNEDGFYSNVNPE